MSKHGGKGHKHTVICPLQKCKYTSRQFIRNVDAISLKNSVFSTKCPKHRTELIPLKDKKNRKMKKQISFELPEEDKNKFSSMVKAEGRKQKEVLKALVIMYNKGEIKIRKEAKK